MLQFDLLTVSYALGDQKECVHAECGCNDENPQLWCSYELGGKLTGPG